MLKACHGQAPKTKKSPVGHIILEGRIRLLVAKGYFSILWSDGVPSRHVMDRKIFTSCRLLPCVRPLRSYVNSRSHSHSHCCLLAGSQAPVPG